jgi:hypothetical protein
MYLSRTYVASGHVGLLVRRVFDSFDAGCREYVYFDARTSSWFGVAVEAP